MQNKIIDVFINKFDPFTYPWLSESLSLHKQRKIEKINKEIQKDIREQNKARQKLEKELNAELKAEQEIKLLDLAPALSKHFTEAQSTYAMLQELKNHTPRTYIAPGITIEQDWDKLDKLFEKCNANYTKFISHQTNTLHINNLQKALNNFFLHVCNIYDDTVSARNFNKIDTELLLTVCGLDLLQKASANIKTPAAFKKTANLIHKYLPIIKYTDYIEEVAKFWKRNLHTDIPNIHRPDIELRRQRMLKIAFVIIQYKIQNGKLAIEQHPVGNIGLLE